MRKVLVTICWLAASVAYAGDWEVGALGGWAYTPKVSVSSPAGSASAGFQQGQVIGAFGGNDSYRYWSGEARYLYQDSGLILSSGGTKATMAAHTHIINGDFLAHFRPRESRIRPFVAFGGGVKVMVGTGLESSTQPLGDRAALTATREVLPVADVGAGIKIGIHKYLRMRFEFRDYISGSPSKVIAAVPGGQVRGVVNDLIGMAGISATW